ncbi:MAG: NAD(P)-dependent alcohol dehydrogenase [Acidimicrobiales bacterium]
MKAIVGIDYGSPDGLRLEDVPLPSPGPKQVLVRVVAASLNPYDWHLMRGKPYLVRLSSGFRRPKRPSCGVDAAGVVEAVGADVTDFKPGDHVFGMCAGSLAEYGVSEERNELVAKPEGLSYERAAALPMAGFTALQAVRRANLEAGQTLLVNGAAGGVGTFAVQIAAAMGAVVTGVCSKANLETVRSLGATTVVDYASEDFTATGHRYDVVLDTVGNRSLKDLRGCIRSRGAVVLIAPHPGNWIGPLVLPLGAIVTSKIRKERLLPMMAKVNRDDLTTLANLTVEGKISPVVSRTYSLGDAAEAMRHLETGHAVGKLVVTI